MFGALLVVVVGAGVTVADQVGAVNGGRGQGSTIQRRVPDPFTH